jgi:hypothetical protein
MNARTILAILVGLLFVVCVSDLVCGQHGGRAMANERQTASQSYNSATSPTAQYQAESGNHQKARRSVVDRLIGRMLPLVAGLLGLAGLGLLMYELLTRRSRSLGTATHLMAASQHASSNGRRRKAPVHAGLSLQMAGSGMPHAAQPLPNHGKAAKPRKVRRAA